MHRYSNMIKFFIGALSVLALALLIYQLPSVHNRLSWRVELITSYVRGVIYPADRMPTPVSEIASRGTPQVLSWTRVPSSTPKPVSTMPTASKPTSTPLPTPTPTPLPAKVNLTPPEYEKQDINNCGPANLALYLRFYGWEGDQFDIVEAVKPLREDRNVNVEELVYFARTQAGWLNSEYRVGSDLEQIKAFLANGIPVVIEESFKVDKPYWPNDDLWAGHYLLITGYDNATETFTAQDTYYGPNQHVSYSKLDEQWRTFNRVIILIYPPEQSQTVQNLLGADWDVDTNRQNALLTAQLETEVNPDDAFAWFNLGANLTYFERYQEAAQAFDNARQIGLPQRMLRYQFSPFIAYFHSGRNQELLGLAEYALERTPNSEEALLWKGWGLFRDGESEKAVDHFLKALEANPTYHDAQYALDFVRQ